MKKKTRAIAKAPMFSCMSNKIKLNNIHMRII